MTFVSTRVQSGLSRREYDEAIVKMSQSKALTKKDKEILIFVKIDRNCPKLARKWTKMAKY